MAAEQLVRHLDWLALGRVKAVSLADLVADESDRDAVAITFDDGLANFGEVAAPMLIERGLPATVFIAPAHIGLYNSWDDDNRPGIPRLDLLSWDEIRGLARNGIEFGGHGHSHIPLRGVDQSTLKNEIESCSRSIASELGVKPNTFAYPYGAYDDASVEMVSRWFDTACTTELRVVAPSDSVTLLPRLDMYYFKDIAVGEMWGTAAFKPYVKLRAAGRAIRGLGKKS